MYLKIYWLNEHFCLSVCLSHPPTPDRVTCEVPPRMVLSNVEPHVIIVLFVTIPGMVALGSGDMARGVLCVNAYKKETEKSKHHARCRHAITCSHYLISTIALDD